MVRRHAGASRIQIASYEGLTALPRLRRRGASGEERERGAGRDRARLVDLNPLAITAVILTKNEAESIERALASLPAGVHALVVDAESTDATVAIARARGAETIVRPWPGFVAARRTALALVRTPWTLMLDADEVLDERLRGAILALDEQPLQDGFRVARTTYLCGRAMRGNGWGREPLLRLFRTERARLVAGATVGPADLHEHWEVVGAAGDLAGTLAHHSYPSLAVYRRKFAAYTSLEAAALAPSRARLLRTAVRAAARLPWLYLVRGGIRDGWRGAFVSAASAAYPVAVCWKALRGSGRAGP